MGGNNVRHSKYHQNVFSPSTQPLSQTVVVAPTDQRSTYVSSHPPLPLQYHRSISLIFLILFDISPAAGSWPPLLGWSQRTYIQVRKCFFFKLFVFLCSRLSNCLVWSGLFWSTRSLRWKRISWKMHIWANQKSFTSAIKTENSKVLHQVTWQGLHRSHSSPPQELHHYPTAWGFTILIWIW